MIRIQKLDSRDMDKAAQLDRLIFGRHAWWADSMPCHLANDFDYLNLAVDEETGTAVGYGIMRTLDDAEVEMIGVHPDYRRQGIGTSLLKDLLNEALHRRKQKVFLDVRASNAPAQALYRSFGFSELALRKNYYSDPVEDDIVMFLQLGTSDEEIL